MGKNKKEVKLDTIDSGSEFAQGDLNWEDLVVAKDEAVRSIIGQQHLLFELASLYKDRLENDQELYASVQGLMKSYQDIASDVKVTMLKHITFEDDKITAIKSGVVDQSTDEYYDYIQIGGEYIAAQEKIGHLAATAYLDIFTQLKLPTTELKKVHDDGSSKVIEAFGEVNGK